MPRLSPEILDFQKTLRDKKKQMILDELDVKRKLQDIKENNLHLVDGKVAYYTNAEYIELVTKLERIHLEAYEMQAQDQIDQIDSEMKQLKAWGESNVGE